MAELKNTVINDTGAINLPSGTTAQRPTNPPPGAMRFNTDEGYTECYYRGFWFDIATGRGLPVFDSLHFLLDASIPESTDGTTGFRWRSIADLAGRDFDFYGTPTYTSNGNQSYWSFNESNHATCENVCATDYVTVETVYRKTGNNPEDILVNKESTWETKTDSDTFQWAVMSSDRSWFWSNSGGTTRNEWYVGTIVYDANNVRSYVNGRRRQIDTGYNNGILGNQTTAYPKINARGSARADRQNPGQHDVAYFAMYDRALDDFEINRNFTALSQRFGLDSPYS